MGTFNGMPSGFFVKDWNRPLYLISPRWDKYVLLPPRISLPLPQHCIVSKQQSALESAYIGVGEVRKT